MFDVSPCQPHAETASALQSIYTLFDAPVPRAIEGCPCCLGSRRVDVLLATPLREITASQIYRYVTGVFLTLGSERDFRYLLPRILDLAINDPAGMPDLEIVLGKLRLAGWSAWPLRERQAIIDLIDLQFDKALRDDLAFAEDGLVGCSSESVLCGAALADLDITPWLKRLGASSAAPIRREIAQQYSAALSLDQPPPQLFWEDAPSGWRALIKTLSV